LAGEELVGGGAWGGVHVCVRERGKRVVGEIRRKKREVHEIRTKRERSV
jgi:hypothetical protein